MKGSTQFLAFDLGAESGRAILGRLRAGLLDLTEVYRFPNDVVRVHESLHWDLLRLWLEMQRALETVAAGGGGLESVGVDTWGCDYGLLTEKGELVGSPYSYRDPRTDGVMDAVFARVPRARVYEVTGTQFLPFNTLYQLYAACERTPRLVDAATNLGMIPDVLNYWLTGVLRAEFTSATTTQMVDARRRAWATELLRALELPARLLPSIIEPGTIVGPLRSSASAGLAGTPVVAPACHDTGSAVASVAATGTRVFLSSGTWSLLGQEIGQPIITAQARDANFTNEGGVAGTTRLLKNISGLWLLQSCRRAWAQNGHVYEYEELMEAADDPSLAFRSLFDPDDRAFLRPGDMPAAIAAYCRRTAQPEPTRPAEYVRAILESLAFKYHVVLDALAELTGIRITEIQIVGGGSRNRLLNQFTADATGCDVLAGPVEATALGNIAVQMLATGAVGSLAEAREIIAHSFPVQRFTPSSVDRWNAQYRRFHDYVELTCV